MARKNTKKQKDWLQIGDGNGYFNRVQQPLQCLIFITPLLLIYQIGSLLHPWTDNGHPPTHVIAFVLMRRFFEAFGAAGNYLPLASVVAILLSWHLARRDKDKWHFDSKLYLGMAGESIAWAIPVFVIGLAAQHKLAGAMALAAAPTGGAAGGELTWETQAVLSVGAGIYEELLFRLIAITVLNMILVDSLEIAVPKAIPIIILTSAVLFAAYHALGDRHLAPADYLFLTTFGIYCAGIFIYRGFGIAVGCHAVYDLIVVAYLHIPRA